MTNKPAQSENLYQQGERFLLAKNYDQAMACFNQWLSTHPADANAMYKMAFTLFITGRIRLALSAYQQALLLLPDHPDILGGIASCEKSLGNKETAILYYEKARTIEPENVQYLYNLALLHDYPLSDPLVNQLLELHQSPAITPAERMIAGFALGKLFERQQEHKQAFTYYAEAARLQSILSPYNETEQLASFDQIEGMFNAPLLEQRHTLGNQDRTPLFILGMPRSGTSLVEQILASHPAVHGAGEIPSMPRLALVFIPQITKHTFPQAMTMLTAQAYASLSEHYLKELRSYCAEPRQHIADKLPNNYLFIGLIRMLYPKAPILHCVRDPMDNCWSLFRQYFMGMHLYKSDLGTLGRYYCRYRKMMRHWHQLLPGEIHDVSYEQLVTQPEPTIRSMLSYCGLSWDDRCLAFHHTERAVSTASAFQVRKPLYTSSMKSWEIVADQLDPLRSVLSPCYE